MALRWESLCSALLLFFAPASAPPGTVAFDLPGPQVEVRVTRAGKTLPIAQIPNLQAGDRIWVHPNLPDEQSVRYVLVAAFLRGATNPPPESWFTKAETWNKQVRKEGIVLMASDESFSNSVSVPLGFVNSEIIVPHPSGTQLYVKLRDNPSVVSVAVPPVITRSAKTPVEPRPAAEPSPN